MALSPLRPASQRATEVTTTVLPSKTYTIDFDAEEISGGIIDGIDAIKQFVRKAVITARYRHLAYTPNYGSELDNLVGQDIPQALLDSEIPRIITDALIYDSRINNVSKFVITRNADGLYVSFTVDSIYGTTNGEVTL
jgi:phage baseplate assembly protein W